MSELGGSPRPTRSFASSTGILLASRVVANVGYLVAVIVIARVLGQEGRGAMAFVTVSALVSAALAQLGVPAAVTVLARVETTHRAQLFTGAALVGLGAGLLIGLVVFMTMALGDFGPRSVSDSILFACIPAPAFIVVFEISLALLISVDRTPIYGSIVAGAPWLYAFSLLAIRFGSTLSVDRAIVAWLIAVVTAGLVGLTASFVITGIGRPDLVLLRSSVGFGFRAWVGDLAGQVNFRFDQILMGLFLTTDSVLGVYALAVNASEVLLYIPTAIAMLLVPFVASTPHGERHVEVTRLFRLSLILTIASVLVAAALGPIAIPLVFGEVFTDSVVPFLLLLPSAIGFVFLRTFTSALVGSSRPAASSVGPVVALLSGVAADFMLIPPYGARGAALAASIAMAAGGVTALVVFRADTRFPLRDVVPRRHDFVFMRAIVARFARRASGGAVS